MESGNPREVFLISLWSLVTQERVFKISMESGNPRKGLNTSIESESEKTKRGIITSMK